MIRPPQIRKGTRWSDMRASDIDSVVQAATAIAHMRTGPGLRFKFSPTGQATLNIDSDAVVRRAARPGLTIEAMTYFRGGADAIQCERSGGTRIDVAKPYLLRSAPFHLQTRGGIFYTYTGPDARTATKGGII